MQEYDFSVYLKDSFEGDLIDDWGDHLFELFQGDVTPAYFCGAPLVDCTLEATSLEAAIARVVQALRQMGLPVDHVHLADAALAFAG